MDNGFVSSRFIQIYIYIQVFRWKKSHYHLEYMFLKMDTCICIQNFAQPKEDLNDDDAIIVFHFVMCSMIIDVN